MPILKTLVLLFLIWRLLRYLTRGRRRPAPDPLTDRRFWALQFAHPYVDATEFGEFDGDVAMGINDHTVKLVRAALLHQMVLRTDASDADVRAHLARMFDAQWFRADLHALQPGDDPHAALAFACARMAFLARLAMLMEWTDELAAWRMLLLNAQRAQDCFANWEEFGRAFVAGRRQWVAGFRADSLGASFDEASLQRWLAPDEGAWAKAGWLPDPCFSPNEIVHRGRKIIA